MSNNIAGFPGPQTPRSTEGSQVQVSRTEPTQAQEETGRPSTVDTVSLTDTAARLRGLENTLASLPVVDTQRVEGLQKSIDNGTYPVDSKRVADKLMAFEGQLNRNSDA